MPLCGFNQEMLEGLEKLHEGLVGQISVQEEYSYQDSEIREEN